VLTALWNPVQAQEIGPQQKRAITGSTALGSFMSYLNYTKVADTAAGIIIPQVKNLNIFQTTAVS